MLKHWKFGALLVCGLFLAAGVLLSTPQPAQARPLYLKQFGTQYPELEMEIKKNKCNVCHYGKKKTDRSNYGTDLSKALGAKNVKDAGKILEALKKTEGGKSAVEGKTFGDLLKEGKLPTSGWEPPAE